MPLSSDQLAEIEAQRAQSHPTRRVVSAGMGERLSAARQVLDYATDYVGDDALICQAARVLRE